MENKINDLVKKICDKYEKDGEDPAIYLESLYHQRYITYWEYIHTEQLLNLQSPVTNLPDEMVFIVYHQITELYFKLILWEYSQLRDKKQPDTDYIKNKLTRIIQYFQHLSNSFAVMTYGMDPEQFMKFRTALTPASGFQSVQFRYIELSMTPLFYLIQRDERDALKNASIDEQYANIYWKQGAIEKDTGKKAMVLRQFEKHYDVELKETAIKWQGKTIYDIYQKLPEATRKSRELVKLFRSLDHVINVSWPKVHYKTAAHYLESSGKVAKATGGTNWKKYLPPRHKRITFFPELWSQEELENWGT